MKDSIWNTTLAEVAHMTPSDADYFLSTMTKDEWQADGYEDVIEALKAKAAEATTNAEFVLKVS